MTSLDISGRAGRRLILLMRLRLSGEHHDEHEYAEYDLLHASASGD
jgi:hypothetical protein